MDRANKMFIQLTKSRTFDYYNDHVRIETKLGNLIVGIEAKQ